MTHDPNNNIADRSHCIPKANVCECVFLSLVTTSISDVSNFVSSGFLFT